MLTRLALVVIFASMAMSAHAQERHPHIFGAQRALTSAERQLAQATNDYGGHRVKAMELIKQAQAELREALEYDEHHEGQGKGTKK